MEKEEFKFEMEKYFKKLNILIADRQIAQFYLYMNLLIEWNEKINLTAITDPKDIILKHFVDCATIENKISKDAKVVDVGTGAGFPGIPLKILRDDLDVVLVDSLNKRVSFLNEVVEKLKLENISAIHSRIEDFGKNKLYRENFDVATSRAVANLSTLAEYMIPLIRVGGNCICMKGSEVKEEINSSNNAVKILGGRVKSVDNFCLPETDMKRNIVIIEKIENTPKKYPRKPGLASKDPIK